MGQASAHFPQRMQGPSGALFVDSSLRYRREEDPFTVVASMFAMARPIMGPPEIIFAQPSGTPPECSAMKDRGTPIRKK